MAVLGVLQAVALLAFPSSSFSSLLLCVVEAVARLDAPGLVVVVLCGAIASVSEGVASQLHVRRIVDREPGRGAVPKKVRIDAVAEGRPRPRRDGIVDAVVGQSS